MEGSDEDLDQMLSLSEAMSTTALCALGQSPYLVIHTAVRFFQDEIEEHIRRKVCMKDICRMNGAERQ